MSECHYEQIKCPECNKIKLAKVEHKIPFNSYVHECECGFIIMESDWNVVVSPKVLTLWQPWATLLVHGIKQIETRPKPTTWTAKKGSYLIHAANKWTMKQSELCCTEPFQSELEKLGYFAIRSKTNLPLGQIIGAVDIEECCKIDNDDVACFKFMGMWHKVEEPELSFGDYAQGRYAWICKNQRILKEPIPYNGGQGYYQSFKRDINQFKFK